MSVETGAGRAVISAAGSRMDVRNMYPFMGGAAQTFGIRSATASGMYAGTCAAQHRVIRFDGKSAF